MEHHVREQGGLQIVAFEGDVDLENSPAARAVLLEAVERGSGVLVDLSGVGYMDSSGVGEIASSFITVRNSHGVLKIAGAQSPVRTLLAVAKLNTVIDVFDTEAEALDSFGA